MAKTKSTPFLGMKPYIVDKGAYKLSIKPINNQYNNLHVQTCILTDVKSVSKINWDKAKSDLEAEMDCFRLARINKIKYIDNKRLEREQRLKLREKHLNEPILSLEQMRALRIDFDKCGQVDEVLEDETPDPPKNMSLHKKYVSHKNNEKKEFSPAAQNIHKSLDNGKGTVAKLEEIKRTAVIIEEIFENI